MSWAILQGRVEEVLSEFPPDFFHGVLCDPPYGYSFMGKAWDYDVPSRESWEEVNRTMRPGAALLSFGGSRTFHRITCGIEDAGLEIRDVLTWLYAKGFPKSLNVEKAGCGEEWSGYGTALKPAWEPVVLARKPLIGTVAANVAAWGAGGLAIDACRIGDEVRHNPAAGNKAGGASYNMSALGMPQAVEGRDCVGRWPANLILDEEAGEFLDATVGDRPSRKSVTRNGGGNQGGAVFTERTGQAKPDTGFEETGGPSRFFFSSKVSTKEREAGCEGLPLKSAGEVTERKDGQKGLEHPGAGAGRTNGARNHHPTLKPISLNTWLAKLIRPPKGGILMVPYAGAGSEMIGALKAGWETVIGIERDPDYIQIARARLAHWCPDQKEA